MYTPKYSEQTDPNLIREFIIKHSFATLITLNTIDPIVSHLPLLLEINGQKIPDGSEGILWGHMARANSQWKHFGTSEVLAIFHGPHSYISPSLYKEKENVPTWNYAVVHAKCTAEIIDKPEKTLEILRKSVSHFEAETTDRWNLQPWNTEKASGEYLQKLTSAIVSFKLTIKNLQGKFKLSQNRSAQDYESVFKAFEKSKNENDQALFELMKKTKPLLL